MAVVADWRPGESGGGGAALRQSVRRSTYILPGLLGLRALHGGRWRRDLRRGEHRTITSPTHWRGRRRGHLEDSRGAHGHRVPTAPALRRLTAGF